MEGNDFRKDRRFLDGSPIFVMMVGVLIVCTSLATIRTVNDAQRKKVLQAELDHKENIRIPAEDMDLQIRRAGGH